MTTRVDNETAAVSLPAGGRETELGGALIVNADDWGRNAETTDRILECIRAGAVSSTSAMVFMEDSGRAAGLAREFGVDAGLHLNLTTPFSEAHCPPPLRERQQQICGYLSRHSMARLIFNPWLSKVFSYVVAAQLEEFSRLYGAGPNRIDGHHHMHLCANVLRGELLPEGTIARRNFTFQAGEKSLGNRLYRRHLDRKLARRHRLTDFFFQLTPLEPRERLQRIFSLARHMVVEVETHPVHPQEYAFLAGGEIFRCAGEVPVSARFLFPAAAARKESR